MDQHKASWSYTHASGFPCRAGPVRRLWQSFSELGWKWKQYNMFETDCGFELNLCNTPVSVVWHWWRAAQRKYLWKQLSSSKRTGIRDIPKNEAGIDLTATTLVCRAKKGRHALSSDARGFLTLALTDGIHTQQRLAAANISSDDDRTCRFCGLEQ